MAYYNPQAYVPGGSTKKKAQAIQAAGRKKPAKTPAGHAPAGAPPRRPYSGYLTAAEVAAQARAEAQKILNSTIAPLQTQNDRLAPQYKAAGEGLAQSLAPLAGQIEALYANNALATKDLASGYSQAVQGVLNADEAAGAGTLARLNLPALGAQPNAAAGDVIYGAGGSLPAQTMSGIGASQAAAASFLPAGARIQARADTVTAQQKIADDIATLRAKQPEIYQSLLTSGRGYQDTLYDNWLQARAQNLYEQKFGVEKLGTAGLDAFGNPIPVKPTTAKNSTERAAERRNAAVKFRNDETADALADMTAWVQEQLKPQKTTMPGGPVEAGEVWDYSVVPPKRVKVYRTKNGGTTKNPNDPNIVIQPVETTQPGKVNYAIARDYIRGQLHNRLDRFNWSKKQINEMAARLLAQMHINPPKGKPKSVPAAGPVSIPAVTGNPYAPTDPRVP